MEPVKVVAEKAVTLMFDMGVTASPGAEPNGAVREEGAMGSVVITAEVGQNHSGSLDTALQLVRAAADAGCDYAKFQKRTVELAVPKEQQDKTKSTPWGEISYLEYRHRLEFGKEEFDIIDARCKGLAIGWFGSAFDIPSAEFLMGYNPRYLKVPSAKLTDSALLHWISANCGHTQPILSTGMSTMDEIRTAVRILSARNPIIMHCTSTYPCPPEELNLRCIGTLMESFPDHTIGYSGHEVGLAPTLAAVAMGAQWVERHITMDRTAWGSDQAASVEPAGFKRLVKDIRLIEQSMGDGIKRVQPGELEPMARLRGA